ncbi:hypothetical protein [Jiulongibacter sediminis]|uniref:Membrane protein n=1 Tax=Jiulongibacter sediminis TaxID=1605367 RepID=A0A0P7BJY2_9BACT|nr:hypothetical protein [Jiulongibacter sediminis]KPM47557.1 membrane protein [Jiulongibacter sediminis]TBX23351.1 membrane protein [Jiulongibacter sediminis]
MIILKGISRLHVNGMTLFPFILIREKEPNDYLIFHERIHIRQQLEMGIFLFYFWYLMEWFIHYLQVKDVWKAYYLISFEKEAYANDKNFNYLKSRKSWSFLKWL